MKKITFISLLLISTVLYAQKDVTGSVTDDSGEPLIGVNVVEKGTTNGTTTDFNGDYRITVSEDATLVFSYIGFNTRETSATGKTVVSITLEEGIMLDEVQLVGSRSPKRTSTDTAVPVDVIDVADVTTQSGRIEINELLQYAAPSFNANKQSGSDGADHIDPATLRGLGPDQTLVLINGKRRHTSSLINIFGTRGRGNSGVDLNSIPASAIKRIEILRDGAAAQYGSDAIAGVINIVLKDATDQVSAFVSYGAYNTNAKGDFPTDTPNTEGNRLSTEEDGNQIGEDKSFDGGSLKAGVNYGAAIGERGYANFTAEYVSKNKTLRPSYTFRRGFGEASIDGFNFFGNASLPVTDNTEIYAFGGRNFRDTDAFAFTRNNPTERNVDEIYPDGFTPRITSIIIDNSVSAGIRTETANGWKIDLSNTYGKNNFHYFIKGTLNASLEESSPSEFDAGGHSLSQNTINLDFSKYYEDVMSGMNLAFGAEYRTENFIIFAGEEGSYATYDSNGEPFNNNTPRGRDFDGDGMPDEADFTVYDDEGADATGNIRPGGSQGFPGYSPANEVDRSRSNISLYADGEFDLSEAFLLNTAVRFENYSDFGSTINGKIAARVKASENINIRGSVSTGFRAPSLAQIYYNLRFTAFLSGIATETLLSPNNSPVTRAFGIGPLKEETALNAGVGFTATFGNFSATVDGYFINVQDRIVLTGTFDATALDIGVSEAQFFANAVDTKTTGLDVVLSWREQLGDGSISATLAGNLNSMEITEVKNGSLDEETFFGERDKGFLLASAPDSKFALNLAYTTDTFNVSVAGTRFSDVVLIDYAGTEDIYDPKLTFDLNVGIKLGEAVRLSVGGNNIFNQYPSQQNDGQTEAGGYWDSVQMGFAGAYYYTRLDLKF